jgi:hypothetical protein
MGLKVTLMVSESNARMTSAAKAPPYEVYELDSIRGAEEEGTDEDRDEG